MSEGDTPVTGPQSIFEAVEAKFPDPALEAETPEEPEAEAAPDAEEEGAEEAQESADEAQEAADAAEDTTPEEDPEDAPEEPQHLDIDTYGDLTVPVVVNGQEQRVTLAEAAKGYQLQADYTRKAQTLSEERKAMEAEREQWQAAYAEKERQLLTQFSQETETEPDWLTLSREDPLGYVEKRAEWDAKKAVREEAQRRLAEQQHVEVTKAVQTNLERLLERRPQWKDREVAQKAHQEILAGGQQFYGFTPDEINATLDARLIEMLDDAVAYRKLRASDAPVVKRVAKTPKVIKSGTAKGTADVKAEAEAAAKRKRAKPHSMEEHMKLLGFS